MYIQYIQGESTLLDIPLVAFSMRDEYKKYFKKNSRLLKLFFMLSVRFIHTIILTLHNNKNPTKFQDVTIIIFFGSRFITGRQPTHDDRSRGRHVPTKKRVFSLMFLRSFMELWIEEHFCMQVLLLTVVILGRHINL